jgi:hypothetical protein
MALKISQVLIRKSMSTQTASPTQVVLFCPEGSYQIFQRIDCTGLHQPGNDGTGDNPLCIALSGLRPTLTLKTQGDAPRLRRSALPWAIM